MATRVETPDLPEFYGSLPRTMEQAYGYRAQIATDDVPAARFTWRDLLRYVGIVLMLLVATGALALVLHK